MVGSLPASCGGTTITGTCPDSGWPPTSCATATLQQQPGSAKLPHHQQRGLPATHTKAHARMCGGITRSASPQSIVERPFPNQSCCCCCDVLWRRQLCAGTLLTPPTQEPCHTPTSNHSNKLLQPCSLSPQPPTNSHDTHANTPSAKPSVPLNPPPANVPATLCLTAVLRIHRLQPPAEARWRQSATTSPAAHERAPGTPAVWLRPAAPPRQGPRMGPCPSNKHKGSCAAVRVHSCATPPLLSLV